MRSVLGLNYALHDQVRDHQKNSQGRGIKNIKQNYMFKNKKEESPKEVA